MTEHEEILLFSKALQDENRLQIINMLQDGEKCACKLLENLCIEQSTLSHHMKILCQSGLITGKKVGKWMHYSINPQGVIRAMILFQQLTAIQTIPPLVLNHGDAPIACKCMKHDTPAT